MVDKKIRKLSGPVSFTSRAVITKVDDNGECEAIHLPASRVIRLMQADAYRVCKSNSVYQMDFTQEQMEKFVSGLTVKKMNELYAVLQEPFMNPKANCVKFILEDG
jgi:hypothetical protein